MKGPTIQEVDCLQAILAKAQHREVAVRMLGAFLWSVWPEWYDSTKEEFIRTRLKQETEGN